MQAAPPIALRPFMLLSSASRCSTSLSPLSTSPMVKSTLAVLGRRTIATKTSAPALIASRLCTCSASNKRSFSTSHGSSEQGRTLASRSATAPRLTEQLQPGKSRAASAILSRLRALHKPTLARSLSTATATLPADATSREYPDPPEPELVLTTPDVARYLLLVAGLVFSIVVVGGLTRLTESGLSITEWNVVSGILPPLTEADWETEFAKYRATPEWKINNSSISLDEFKTIFYWEWGHRIIGRVIGLAFLLPIPYFMMRRRLSPRVSLGLLGIGTLIGGQGALGWYMVKSGLDAQQVIDLGGVPRVSQYRLAAHLGMAFLVYAGCVRLALGTARDFKLIRGGADRLGAGLAGQKTVQETLATLNGRTAGRVRVLTNALTALVFLTAISGAFVAGLDAGLVYNEFPLMGGRLIPPTSELFDPHYAVNRGDPSLRASKTSSFALWRNFFENPTTVQFDHRVLATTTFLSVVSLFMFVRRPHIKAALPPTTYRLIKGTMHMAFLQVALGISTLVYLVPIHLAATHQAGSLVLLTLALASGASLRRPGKVARELLKRGRVAGQFTKPANPVAPVMVK